MTVKTDPHTFNDSGTDLASGIEVNERFDQLYTLQNGGIDSTNMDLTSSFSWTGNHTFGGTGNTLKLNSGTDLKIFSDVSTTLKFQVDGATGDVGIPAARQIFLADTSLTSGSSIRESSSGVVMTKATATDSLSVTATGIGIPATAKWYLDGVAQTGNTYWQESSADVMIAKANNVTLLTIDGTLSKVTAAGVEFSGSSIYCPGNLNCNSSGTIAIASGAPNTLTLYHNGTSTTATSAQWAFFGTQFTIQSNGTFLTANDGAITLNLRFGGAGSDTFIRESSADVLTFTTGGTDRIQVSSSGFSPSTTIALGTTSKPWSALTLSGKVQWDFSTSKNIDFSIANSLILNVDGSNSVSVTTTGFKSSSIELGSSSTRWIKGWFTDIDTTNAVVVSSDRNLKKEIVPSDLGLQFINGIAPVSYRLKDGDGSKHYGIIAQDLEVLLDGREFGGLKKPSKDKASYSIAYTDLIAPLIKAVQELDRKVELLRAEKKG